MLFQSRLAVRRLSTATRHFAQSVVKRTVILSLYMFASIGLIMVMVFGVQKEILDQKFATPDDWSWSASRTYKGAYLEETQGRRSGIINWAGVGQQFLSAARILEDLAKDGKGLRLVRRDAPILNDAKNSGTSEGEPIFDLSAKSDEWIQGYHTCWMGVAKSAENCEGMLLDTTQNLLCPKDVVIGPSNPRPKPMGMGAFSAPREENCVPVFETADRYYLKILHTHGFNARQRLEAALALADWYDYKGLTSQAEEVYDWGLDIAQGALPIGVNEVVDMKTGIINGNTTYVSANMLAATTALAQFQARHDNLSGALSIFLSVLRARRQLLRPDDSIQQIEAPPGTWAEFYISAKGLLFPPPRQPVPTDGNEIPVRTKTAICEEAGIMSHVGEILLASSLSKEPQNSEKITEAGQKIPLVTNAQGFQSGLSWTREAVDLAEETLLSLGDGESGQGARTKCSQCLAVGMSNWSSMVQRMLKDVRTSTVKPQRSAVGNLFWGREQDQESVGRWEGEAQVAESRAKKIRRLIAAEENRPLPWWMTVITNE